MFAIQKIKEEPLENNVEAADEIIASYRIVALDSGKFKTFAVSGLSNICDRTEKQCNLSIRTDLKELKIETEINNDQAVFSTKECNMNLKKKFFAMKLSRDTGKAFVILLNSVHSISYLDAANRSSKAVDNQNLIYEHCCKMPNPSRNKHDQLRIEMKNHLYKPLKLISNKEQAIKFLNDFFSIPHKKTFNVLPDQMKPKIIATDPKQNLDLLSCHFWHLNTMNLCDIKSIEFNSFKIEIFLRKVQVARFSEIQLFLNVPIDELLNVLQNTCYLIRGNWVIKSKLLYKYDTIHDSENKQTHFKDLITVREYLLWIFANNFQVKVSQIYSKYTKTSDHIDILQRLTIRRGFDSIVEFILNEDSRFIVEHSSIAQNHHRKTVASLNVKFQAL